MEREPKYIYGPVSSWRLGASLGIDPVSSDKKTCTFDCIYCQILDEGAFSKERRVFVETKRIIEEIKSLPSVKIDYFTFSGCGEPTLAKNLGELIKAVKKLRKEKIAVITNSSLIKRSDVRADLALADFVILKLDAPSEELSNAINRPVEGIEFKDILEGIKDFRKEYKNRMALQIMFVEENKDKAKELAAIATQIAPDEVQINTPLRPSGAKPLSREEIQKIKHIFSDTPGFKADIVSVYEGTTKKVSPVTTGKNLKKRGR